MNELDDAIKDMNTDRVWELMFIDFVKGKMNRVGMATLQGHGVTIQCVINNTAREQPKKKK